MTPHYTDDHLSIFLGDCLEVMPTLEAGSVDAVVTDPPYSIGFMGRDWDKNLNHGPWAREAFRLLKPGGHLLAFGGTRTYHRLTSAIEDAGFEIRDCLVWAYASGFPKSLDVGKAIDRAAGAEREVLGVGKHAAKRAGSSPGLLDKASTWTDGLPNITAPATPDAKRWDGWGTALKPAWEPIVMARKPLAGTVAANVLKHGTGALNIDGTRIAHASPADAEQHRANSQPWTEWKRGGSILEEAKGMNTPGRIAPMPETAAGRWPANVILTDPIFDGDTPGVVGGGATGPSAPASGPTWEGPSGSPSRSAFNGMGDRDPAFYGDTGTYSRFFLIPKEARSGREPAVRGSLPLVEQNAVGPTVVTAANWDDPEQKRYERHTLRANTHPTVKPLELMRHLVRLVTPPGGTVLDCFLGSGTTALAAVQEGFRCIGIEREPEYIEITMARLHGTQTGMGLDVELRGPKAPKTHPDLSKHQPKRRAPAENYSGGWIGTEAEE